MKKETYNRSRMLINEYITYVCTKHYTQDKKLLPNNAFLDNRNGFILFGEVPPIGSLCRLLFTNSTKYYLSWFLGKKDNKFIMQSIEDHEICEWSNIAIEHIPIDFKTERPQFFYTDSQFKFHDKWDKIVKATNYNMVPMWSKFSSDTNQVTLTIRWKFNEQRLEKTFNSWKTLTNDEMKHYANEILANGIV